MHEKDVKMYLNDALDLYEGATEKPPIEDMRIFIKEIGEKYNALAENMRKIELICMTKKSLYKQVASICDLWRLYGTHETDFRYQRTFEFKISICMKALQIIVDLQKKSNKCWEYPDIRNIFNKLVKHLLYLQLQLEKQKKPTIKESLTDES